MHMLSPTSPSPDSVAAIDQPAFQARLAALEASINDLYEHAPFGSHTLAADGTYLHINAVQRGWLGLTSDALVGKKQPTDFLTPASQTKYQQHLASHGRRGFADLALDMQVGDGPVRPVLLSFLPHAACLTDPTASRTMLFDETVQKRQAEQRRVAAMAFESLAGMCVTDSLGRILLVNRAFTTLTGYTEEEAVSQHMSMLSSGRHNRAFYQAMWAAINTHGRWQGEVINRRRDGQVIAEWQSISAITNADGHVTHYTATFYDITANRAAQEHISHLAYFDPLTQLPNRALLRDRLAHAVAASDRHSKGGAVMFIDLDNFKAVNDTQGHDAGDELLIHAAKRISAAVRETDTVARLGGDEFVLLLDTLAPPPADFVRQVAMIGHKVLAALAQPYVLGKTEFVCAASMGITLMAADATPSVLLQQADLAMYQAKKMGGNALCFFDPAMQDSVAQRVGLEQDLRRALRMQQFHLQMQPQVNEQGHIVGAEALLRWHPTGRGAVPPSVFIPLAEESGLIVPIGDWVLDTACQQLKAWATQPHTRDLQLAVNVSARQFAQPDFAQHVIQTIDRHGIDPTRLKLEITESMVLDVADLVVKMSALRAVGVRFSMDDFGTGYSSLSHLTNLPLDQLKIDQSFVFNMHAKPTDAAIVRTIIAMAHGLGLEVIAEGVETDEQRAFLLENGCLLYQGYLCGRPMAVSALEALLAQDGIKPSTAAQPGH
jgi:diguanylate cyclase (GGDEF)-like protein/PAS domain S-box-containing protein